MLWSSSKPPSTLTKRSKDAHNGDRKKREADKNCPRGCVPLRAFVDLRLRADQRQRAASAVSAACSRAAASRRARSRSAARTHATAIGTGSVNREADKKGPRGCVPLRAFVDLRIRADQRQGAASAASSACSEAAASHEARSRNVASPHATRDGETAPAHTDRRKPDIRQHIFYNRWAIHGVPPGVDMC